MITRIIIKIQAIKNHLVISLTMIFVNRAKNKMPKNETNKIKNVLKSIIVLNELIYEISKSSKKHLKKPTTTIFNIIAVRITKYKISFVRITNLN